MLTPLNDRIVVKIYEPEHKTSSGLILGTSDKTPQQFGKVIAVGPGTEDTPMILTAGQKVIFSRLVGTEVKMNGEEFIILRLKDVLGVVEDETTLL